MATTKPKAPQVPKKPALVDDDAIVEARNNKGETLTMRGSHYNRYAEDLELVTDA